MYARYVPPKKGTRQPSAVQNDPLPPVRPTSWNSTNSAVKPVAPSLPILAQGRKTTFDDEDHSSPPSGKPENSDREKTNETKSDRNTEKGIEKNDEKQAKKHGEKKREKHSEAKHSKTDKKRKIDDISGDEETNARHQAVLQKKNKSLKRAQEQTNVENADETAEEVLPPAELHGIEPLPQPEPVAEDVAKPTYDTLPPWLANPDRVSPHTRTLFSNFKIGNERAIVEPAEEALKKQGWAEATAIQTAVLPMLLPSWELPRDLVISASTGSGKTLSYVLPIIREISRLPATELTAVVIVPTRELVQQAHDVCKACAQAFGAVPGSRQAKIGVAAGHQSFETEKRHLVIPAQGSAPGDMLWGWRPRLELYGRDIDDILFDTNRQGLDLGFSYDSAVDILICTPGRLVDHINLTPGFTLDNLRWLVIDEADKLLGQDYQQWLDIVMSKLVKKGNAGMYRGFGFGETVRKVVLSATMSRDLSVLNRLQLKRPRYVALEGNETTEGDENRGTTDFVLPEHLHESAIKVRDESHKPLYLIDLLTSEHVAGEAGSTSSSSSEDSSSSSSEDSSDDEQDHSHEQSRFQATAVIFTKSNENALRLSRLLVLLAPRLSQVVGTITSSIRTSERRKTLRAFEKGNLRILVSSDLAGRGVDLKNVDHVINYDMPQSVQNYVHRVGRTARAGRSGHAWTFFSKKEAGWFWAEVAGEKKKKGGDETLRVQRRDKVAKVVVGDNGRFDDTRLEAYEEALKQLSKEAA